MTNPQESNTTATNSAPPVSQPPTTTGSTSGKNLATASQCLVKCNAFFSSPASECRCWCSDCQSESKNNSLDDSVTSKNAEKTLAAPVETEERKRPVMVTESMPLTKRARHEDITDKECSKPVVKKQKKKKFSSILKGMMSATSKPVDVDKDRETLLRGLGGGNFVKIAKI